MVILSKECKPGNFGSHNSQKLSITNISGLHHSIFIECEPFLESNFPDILALYENILALYETNLDDSIDSGNFFVSVFLLLIRNDSVTHVYVLAVYVK